MTDYIRVHITSDDEEANKYIKKGWDLIDTSKSVSYETGGSYTKYSLGFSTREYSNQLLAIIKDYEKHGFKELLFEKVAEEMDDKIDDYETTGYRASNSSLAVYMTKYENVVHDQNVMYSKKRKNDPMIPIEADEFDDTPF